VSLDCFCGLYPCPSQGELLAGWAESAEASNELSFIGGMLDANAQVWLSTARYSGQRYAFDASGALVGAIAFSQGPSTLPCNTNWVAAGPCERRSPPKRVVTCPRSVLGGGLVSGAAMSKTRPPDSIERRSA
jgi:hypothetical protein